MSQAAVTRDTDKANAPSADAVRQRRRRQRLEAGAVVIDVAIAASALDWLISCGWLRQEDRADRKAVKAATVALVVHALQQSIRRP